MNTTILQAQEVFQRRPNAGVVQDNQPPRRLTAASDEPATATVPAVGNKGGTASEGNAVMQLAVDRPTHHGSETRQTEQVTGRVLPVLKAQLLQVAKQRGAKNESRAVAMAVEVFVANEFGKQFLAMIRQTIQETVRQEFRNYTNRMGKLSFHAYLAAEQGRLMEFKRLRNTLAAKDIGKLPQMIQETRQEALDNLKFYNYSLEYIEKMIDEKVPWQS
jgi:hypothetical protein